MYSLRLFLLLALTALGAPDFCQAPASLPANLASLDQHALRTPAAERKSLERLTAYLIKPYGSEPEKVRSMYAWIVNNIRYPDSIAALRRLLPPERELKTARTAHQFDPGNHVSIGLALNNYGTYVARPGAGSPKTDVGFKINKQQEALGYYAEALRHLRKTDRKDFVHTCRENSRTARATIKRLKKYRRKAPGE